MSTYGPNSGTVPFTGYTGTLGAVNASAGVTSGAVHADLLTQQDRAISFLMRRPGSRKQRELLLTLIGAAAGDAALETRKRVLAGEWDNPTGDIELETVNVVNRVTAAADVTALTAMLSRAPIPIYVEDASGNGGGGRSA